MNICIDLFGRPVYSKHVFISSQCRYSELRLEDPSMAARTEIKLIERLKFRDRELH